ncbi:hypothetical protein JMJ77_0008724 [Colletotrichum scovillei]|uniref:Uncharacterized protein n=1 Tax=Colletotrichum scovillei TaxID=1209932 RepID=A0A9P7QR36_9PEZI|nr:hypothetical protein JMJ78_0001582 [Colletotrichum scovillei]KAG7041018.1 hypothetical protein JMJ77_0008724 [Colletotrichum scovillei]KAG7061051.1 hypothetical protein JMJ76_0010122 [Colletotrichum scovillei]
MGHGLILSLQGFTVSYQSYQSRRVHLELWGAVWSNLKRCDWLGGSSLRGPHHSGHVL